MALRIQNIDNPHVITYQCVVLEGQDGCLLTAGTLPGSQSYVSMDINPANGLTLGYDIPGLAPKVQLGAQGIQLSVGPPGSGATAKLTATGITLQYGPPAAGASVTLDSSGVTLKVGPTTTLQLTPTGITLNGITLKLNADAALQVSAKMLDESVTGIVSRSAAMQKIG